MLNTVQPEINFGAEVCRLIKAKYFPETPWDAKLANKVARIFTLLKSNAKPFFPDDTHVDMLRKIGHYSKEDFEDLIDVCGLKIEQEVLHGTSQGQNRIHMG